MKDISPSNLIEDAKKRRERMNDYLNLLEKTLKEMQARNKKTGNLTSFEQPEIEAQLTNCPAKIVETGILVARFQRAYEYAKLTTQTIQAQIWKEINSQKDQLGLTNAKDRDAYVKTKPELINALKEELEWKYYLDRIKVINEGYENLFTAVRKLASLIPEQNKIQDQAQKYL